jgi:hypothetical protein
MINAIFSNESWNQFIERDDTSFLSSANRFKHPAGTLVYFLNKDTRELVGVGVVSTWEDGSVCRCRRLAVEGEPIGPFIGELSKYNSYEIAMKDVRILRNPIRGDSLAELLGINPKLPNNIVKGFHGYTTAHYNPKEDPETNRVVLRRFRTLLQSLL